MNSETDIPLSEAGDIRTLDDVVETRANVIADWLDEHAPRCQIEQKHLDEGSPERAYWHYGYLMALRDIRNTIRNRQTSLN